MITDRRGCVRHKVNGPIFASFDGITGGMILDLSEQGLSMQTAVPLEADRRIQLRLEHPDFNAHLETTGYIAWADALGRAGVRFTELPIEARRRLEQWLAFNDAAPSRKAPTLSFEQLPEQRPQDGSRSNSLPARRSVSLEAIAGADEIGQPSGSSSIQYEFNSLGSNLDDALRVISQRAQTLLRGTGAAIAIAQNGPIVCRASVGACRLPLGTPVDVNSGLSGECIRTGKPLLCRDAEKDSRIDALICRQLGIRSVVAAPLRYEREVVGVLEVFSPQPFAFDNGDLAVLERLAQTALLVINHIPS